jgi:taurine transport system substrate-binding protein
MKSRFAFVVAAVALGLAGTALAQKKEVTFAHQDMLVPLRTVMESGELEKATGYKINWRMFGGGGDVIKAMASGDVQIGEAGSSPIVAAASQGQDIKLFWILDDIADAEALIVRNGSGINSVKDLKGKKVATPFVSTAHYQLMAVMKTDGVDAKGVNVMNMRPPEIAAAWERGDIDAAFIWDPVLSKIKGNGKVIESSKTIGKRGFPTFDGLIVNAKWAAENEAFMVTLVKVLAKADAQYTQPTRPSGPPTRPRPRPWPSGPRPTPRTCRRRWRCTPSRRWPNRPARTGWAALPSRP